MLEKVNLSHPPECVRSFLEHVPIWLCTVVAVAFAIALPAMGQNNNSDAAGAQAGKIVGTVTDVNDSTVSRRYGRSARSCCH